MRAPCLKIACNRPSHAFGLCQYHYKQAHMPNYRSPMFRVSLRTHQVNLRARALAALGDICIRCGFSDDRALQIDHRDGGGSKHTREVSWSKRYFDVINNPGKYQCLCANCNWIKRAENKEATGRPRVA